MVSFDRSAPVVLIADDNPDDRLLLQQAWEMQAQVQLHLVKDGKELVDFLQAQAENGPTAAECCPDLILLDLNMPRKNGFEVLTELRAKQHWRRVPIVVMTTSQAEIDIDRAYELGANSCFTKPQSFQALLSIMATLNHYWFKTVCLPSSGNP